MPDLKMSNHHSTIPPCKDCSDREIGCHSYCKAYGEWAKAEKVKRDETKNKRELELLSKDYSIKCVESRKKGMRKWHRNRRTS